MTSVRINSAPVFDLCSAHEQHFLLDLIQQEEPGALDDHAMAINDGAVVQKDQPFDPNYAVG